MKSDGEEGEISSSIDYRTRSPDRFHQSNSRERVRELDRDDRENYSNRRRSRSRSNERYNRRKHDSRRSSSSSSSSSSTSRSRSKDKKKRKDRKEKRDKKSKKSSSSSSSSSYRKRDRSPETTKTSGNNNTIIKKEQTERSKEIDEKIKTALLNERSAGVYIPPYKLAMMQKEVQDKSSVEYQRIVWDALKKSINGLVNKVSISNVKNIAVELFGENIIRGRGLFCRSLMRAQQISMTFTNVYAALVAIINTKIPENGLLLLKRLIEQFKKSFRRNDKPVCIASCKFIASLFNQQICSVMLPLEILTLLLDKPSDDSVEVAIELFKDSGQMIQTMSSLGFNSIYGRFKDILHEGQTDKRTQYMIEDLFKVVRNQFKDYPSMIPELDVVEIDDQVPHMELTLDETYQTEENSNFFQQDKDFLQHEEEYTEFKRQILGDSDDEDEENDEADGRENEEEDEDDESLPYIPPTATNSTSTVTIEDQTDKSMKDFKKTIYLTIMSSKDFEECAHKILRMKIKGLEKEVCNMIVQCCSQEKTYLPLYGNLAQRFCMVNRMYQELYSQVFKEQYETIHRLEVNKFRNIAKMYAHLFYTDAISWAAFECIHINDEETNSASRIFIKILFQEMAEFLGIQKLSQRLFDPDSQGYFSGIFPRDIPKNTRYSINFFTSISLGALTIQLREYLKNAPTKISSKDRSSSSDSDSSDSDSSDSDSSSSSSSSDSEEERRRKKLRR